MLEKFNKSYISASTFVSRAYAAFDQLDKNERLRRKGDESKKLVEEVLPIAAFLKYFEIPCRPIRCKYFSGDQNYDAKIKISGRWVEKDFLKGIYFIEVTWAVCPNEYLHREALERYGGVFCGGDIRRDGSRNKGNDQIVSRAVVQDSEAPLIKAIDWVGGRLKDKASKSYPKNCILIVQIHPERRFDLSEWVELAERVNEKVNYEIPFSGVYLVDGSENIVIPMRLLGGTPANRP